MATEVLPMDCDAVLDSLLAGVGVSLKKPSPSAPSSPASSVSVSELCGSPSFPSSVDLGALLSPQLPVAGSVPEPPAAPTRKSQKGKGRKRAATEEEKKQRQVERIMKNRASAQDSRNRKRAYLSALESQNALLRQQNSTLVSRVSALESQNAALATQLAALQPLLDFVAIQTGPEPAALPSPQRTRFFPALSSLQLSLLAENWRVLRTWMLLCERISILAALSLGRRISMVPTSRGVGSRYKSLSLGKGCGWEVAMARR